MAKRNASVLDRIDGGRSRRARSRRISAPTEKAQDNVITTANGLTTEDFQRKYIDVDLLEWADQGAPNALGHYINFRPAADLTEAELNSCFQLIETTSRPDYEPSSFGWHPNRKKREMKGKDMRYILIESRISASALPDEVHAGFAGFLSFMLTYDSTPSVPVLYVYEIHLAPQLRGCGFGTRLMQTVEDIAAKVGVEKVMLTCFLSNSKAQGFYRSLGYDVDACSPEDRETRQKSVKVDYVIMSKAVQSRRH